jgi:hypothetical protein
MNKITQVLILIALATGLGTGFWAGRKSAKIIPTSPTSPTSPITNTGAQAYIQLLLQQLASATSQAKKITRESKLQLDSLNKVYQDTIHAYHRLEIQQLEIWTSAVTAGDSLKACSAVFLTCRERADLAERRAEDLRAQLARQTGLQPSPCGFQATVGPSLQLVGGIKVSRVSLTLGVGCRLF